MAQKNSAKTDCFLEKSAFLLKKTSKNLQKCLK